MRNALRAFDAQGVAALTEGSSRPHTIHAAFDADRRRAVARAAAPLAARLRPSRPASGRWNWRPRWPATEGLTPTRVSDETVRATLERLGIRWRRAKAWITSPDPAYAQKNGGVTG